MERPKLEKELESGTFRNFYYLKEELSAFGMENGLPASGSKLKWLKENTGKTYREAIAAYHRILEGKKTGKPVIDKQFEYNTYIRDFFADNKEKTLEEASVCWKYKRNLLGHNQYERTDLVSLQLG